MKSSELLVFNEIETGTKTQKWAVVNAIHGVHLGFVKWYGAWRKYTFFPGLDTVFDPDCLFTIAEFCENRTKEYKS